MRIARAETDSQLLKTEKREKLTGVLVIEKGC
jgi:hypothetical protein